MTSDSITDIPAVNERARYITSLRDLALLLEQDERLPLPSSGRRFNSLTVSVDTRDEMAAWVEQISSGASEKTQLGRHHVTGKVLGLDFFIAGPAEVFGRKVTRQVTEFEVEPFLPVTS